MVVSVTLCFDECLKHETQGHKLYHVIYNPTPSQLFFYLYPSLGLKVCLPSHEISGKERESKN